MRNLLFAAAAISLLISVAMQTKAQVGRPPARATPTPFSPAIPLRTVGSLASPLSSPAPGLDAGLWARHRTEDRGTPRSRYDLLGMRERL